ncbi:hypothetical protein [Pareuzebyella sediminis]|uniref:hypothetical protein n=1 Tax=Pareuzebyella sediminis TaxID=2607998 RepID=UPI0011EEE58C|nr:hypothetical protein [Pareuzebyella sediminis]
MKNLEIDAKIKTAQINNALGVFIMVFGLIVLFAITHTVTFVQQMTDLVAGLFLIAVGGGMIWKSRRSLKKFKKK